MSLTEPAAMSLDRPFKHRYLDLFRMLPPQLRRATGEIRIPAQAESGDYDLVVIGSPTWWLTTCMPIRSYLKSDAAAKLLKGKSVAGFVVCRRYWKNNLKTVQSARGTQRRNVCRHDALHVPRRAGAIPALTHQLPRHR